MSIIGNMYLFFTRIYMSILFLNYLCLCIMNYIHVSDLKLRGIYYTIYNLNMMDLIVLDDGNVVKHAYVSKPWAEDHL